MSHQAIYRKFRPKVFDDVIGQEHVTDTIKNQILNNNIAHAYLFSGIRGTGKTSTAKIFARAVNCLNNKDGNPCNECEICKSTLNETNLDVIEMDAASNNSVEDIRDLRDKVKFMPVKSKYKVYIIDEVHMLSKGAFNALLKTLEEPPEHLLFILATTEPHKIPATILSRCQRFDLKRHSLNNIVDNLKKICSEINIEVEEKALKLIAGNADGAMRDALSILDRCITFGYEKIDYEMVLNLLGTVNYETIIKTTEAIVDKDIENVMNIIDSVLNQGKELTLFLEDLIIHFRNLLIVKTTESSNNILKTIDEVIESLKEQSSKLDTDEIIMYIEELSETQLECKRALNPRVLFEAKLIKMMETKNTSDMNSLIKRIEKLETAIRDGIVTVNAKTPSKKTVTKTKLKTDVKPSKTIDEPRQKIKQISSDTNSQIEQIKNSWSQILKAIRNEKISLYAILRECKPVGIKENTALFEFDTKYKFHMAAADKENNKNEFKKILNNCLGTNYEVKFMQENENVENNEDEIAEEMEKKVVEMFGEDLVEIE